jgi:hypothetical protein
LSAQYKFRNLSLILSFLALTLVATVGCGGAASASSSPAAAVPESAHIVFSPTALDFGSVLVGVQKTSSVTVTNSRGSAATISQITATGAGFSVISVPKLPLVISAGQSATVTVAFQPASAGPASGNFSVSFNGTTPSISDPLSGSGIVASQLSVSPTALAFGNVLVGSSQKQTGSLTAGGSSVTVSSGSVTGAGYSLSGITFPVTIAAGTSIPFTVTFAPQTTSTSTGSVSFFSNASNSPATETFSGSGLQPAHSVDVSWNASTSVVAGYNIYRGSQSGGPYTRLNSSLDPGTTYTDNNVQSGATYFYVVTAVDGSSQESIFSNESTAVIPVP